MIHFLFGQQNQHVLLPTRPIQQLGQRPLASDYAALCNLIYCEYAREGLYGYVSNNPQSCNQCLVRHSKKIADSPHIMMYTFWMVINVVKISQVG